MKTTVQQEALKNKPTPDAPVEAQVVIHLFMKEGQWGSWVQVKCAEAITPARALRLAACALRDRILNRIMPSNTPLADQERTLTTSN